MEQENAHNVKVAAKLTAMNVMAVESVKIVVEKGVLVVSNVTEVENADIVMGMDKYYAGIVMGMG